MRKTASAALILLLMLVLFQATPASGEEGAQKKENKGYATGNDLNVREEPGTSYPVIVTLSKGDEVKVNKTEGDLLHIKTSGKQKGWVNQAYITYVNFKDDGDAALPSDFPNLKGKKIMIDPGHGGTDGGAIGQENGTLEKNINLYTALILEQKLTNAGASVYMTRSADLTVSLVSRPQLSNQFGVDGFVSVHYNSGSDTSAGIETFYQEGSSFAPMAYLIQKSVVENTGLDNRGTGAGNLQVLRTNQRPAV